LSALKQQIESLRHDDADPRMRAEALRFVIHFVGDLHQPLHCASNNDLGGICLPVDFFGAAPVEENLQYESYAPNLHAIWESNLIERLKGMASTVEWATSLDHQFSSQVGGWKNQGINLEDWAWESHELADAVAYGKLPVGVPDEWPPVEVTSCADDDHVSTRLLKLHEEVTQRYADVVSPTINEQIAKAGVRLAMILNQIWP
jgi:hypothetical protein